MINCEIILLFKNLNAFWANGWRTCHKRNSIRCSQQVSWRSRVALFCRCLKSDCTDSERTLCFANWIRPIGKQSRRVPSIEWRTPRDCVPTPPTDRSAVPLIVCREFARTPTACLCRRCYWNFLNRFWQSNCVLDSPSTSSPRQMDIAVWLSG